MTTALSPPTAGPPDDVVRRATADPETAAGLRAHAAARLRVLLYDRAEVTRADRERGCPDTVQRAGPPRNSTPPGARPPGGCTGS